jgi:hypothetical protein
MYQNEEAPGPGGNLALRTPSEGVNQWYGHSMWQPPGR